MLENHSCCGAMADIGDLPQLGSEPVHPGPDYPFPKRKLVNQQLWSALVIYFRSWPWLTYEESEDKVLSRTSFVNCFNYELITIDLRLIYYYLQLFTYSLVALRLRTATNY